MRPGAPETTLYPRKCHKALLYEYPTLGAIELRRRWCARHLRSHHSRVQGNKPQILRLGPCGDLCSRSQKAWGTEPLRPLHGSNRSVCRAWAATAAGVNGSAKVDPT